MADNRRATDDLASVARQIEQARGALSGTIGDAETITRTLGIGEEYREVIAAAHGSVLGGAFGQAELGKLAARGIDLGPTLEQLHKSTELSREVSAALRASSEREAAARALRASEVRIEDVPYPRIPELPRNPILETNELLGDVAEDIASLSTLSAQQIEIQAQQVELINRLLIALVEGSASQDEALKVARRNLWIAIVAVAVSVVLGVAALV